MNSTNPIFPTLVPLNAVGDSIDETGVFQTEAGEEASEHYWSSFEVTRLLKDAVKFRKADHAS